MNEEFDADVVSDVQINIVNANEDDSLSSQNQFASKSEMRDARNSRNSREPREPREPREYTSRINHFSKDDSPSSSPFNELSRYITSSEQKRIAGIIGISYSLNDLIARYCPFFMFHKGETHRPISWEAILRSSQLMDLEGKLLVGNADLLSNNHFGFGSYCVDLSSETSRRMGDLTPIYSSPYQLRLLHKMMKKHHEQSEVQCLASVPIWNGVRWGVYLTYWLWVPTFRFYRFLDKRFFQRNNSSPIRTTCSGRNLNAINRLSRSRVSRSSIGGSRSSFPPTRENNENTLIDPFHPDAPWIRHPGVVTVYLECEDIQDIEGKSLSFDEFSNLSTSLNSLNDTIRWVSPSLLRVFMSQQGCGRWYRPEDCEMEAGRVVVYAVEGNAGRAWCPGYENTRILSLNLGCSKRQLVQYDPVDNIVCLVSPHHPSYCGEITGERKLFYFSGVVGNEISPIFVPQLQMPWLMIDKAVGFESDFREKTWPQLFGRCGMYSFFFIVWTYGSVEPFVVLYLDDNYPFILMVITRFLVVLSSLIFTKLVLN
jgi:hypothetical protein